MMLKMSRVRGKNGHIQRLTDQNGTGLVNSNNGNYKMVGERLQNVKRKCSATQIYCQMT